MGTLASRVPGAALADRYRLHSRLATQRQEELWRGTDVVLAHTVVFNILPGREARPGP
jgi:hypothetical protein